MNVKAADGKANVGGLFHGTSAAERPSRYAPPPLPAMTDCRLPRMRSCAVLFAPGAEALHGAIERVVFLKEEQGRTRKRARASRHDK